MAIIAVGSKEVSANIVVVSRTRMSQGHVCIGAFDVENNRNIRLLTAAGEHQPEACELDVGSVVRATYVKVTVGVIPPHTEDVKLKSYTAASQVQKVKDEFVAACPVVHGPITATFSGSLSREGSNSLSIRRENVPDHSVCFWKSDQIILLDSDYRERFGKVKYLYGQRYDRVGLPYVGMQDPIPSVPAGTVVRLSLARWWKPNDASYDDKRCQKQLSGWYL